MARAAARGVRRDRARGGRRAAPCVRRGRAPSSSRRGRAARTAPPARTGSSSMPARPPASTAARVRGERVDRLGEPRRQGRADPDDEIGRLQRARLGGAQRVVVRRGAGRDDQARARRRPPSPARRSTGPARCRPPPAAPPPRRRPPRPAPAGRAARDASASRDSSSASAGTLCARAARLVCPLLRGRTCYIVTMTPSSAPASRRPSAPHDHGRCRGEALAAVEAALRRAAAAADAGAGLRARGAARVAPGDDRLRAPRPAGGGGARQPAAGRLPRARLPRRQRLRPPHRAARRLRRLHPWPGEPHAPASWSAARCRRGGRDRAAAPGAARARRRGARRRASRSSGRWSRRRGSAPAAGRRRREPPLIEAHGPRGHARRASGALRRRPGAARGRDRHRSSGRTARARRTLLAAADRRRAAGRRADRARAGPAHRLRAAAARESTATLPLTVDALPGARRRRRRRSARAALERVGHRRASARRQIAALSGGQFQRALLAQALLRRPRPAGARRGGAGARPAGRGAVLPADRAAPRASSAAAC